MLNKLFHKDAVLAHNASPLFRATPYILFGCMWLAVGIVPVLATSLPFAPAADVIALVGLFALARVFISLAGMDIGTSFGTLGARREMMIGFLAEPAMLMTLFTASLISHSTSLVTIVSMYELTGALSLALNSDVNWRPFKIEAYLFITIVYFIFCFAMSRYSLWVEKQLATSKSR